MFSFLFESSANETVSKGVSVTQFRLTKGKIESQSLFLFLPSRSRETVSL